MHPCTARAHCTPAPQLTFLLLLPACFSTVRCLVDDGAEGSIVLMASLKETLACFLLSCEQNMHDSFMHTCQQRESRAEISLVALGTAGESLPGAVAR